MLGPRVRRLAACVATGAALTLGATGGYNAYAGAGQVSAYGAAERATHVVTLGDSVTAGTNCSCDDFGRLLAQDFANTVGGGTVTNFGKAGETSPGLVSQLARDEVREALTRAEVVVVTIGANDIDVDEAHDPAPIVAETGRRVDQALTTIAQIAPRAKVVVTGYWNVVQDGDVAQAQGPEYVAASEVITAAVNDELHRRATEHHALYADLAEAYRAASPDATTLLAEDGDHPNAAGHRVIADAIEKALQPPAPTPVPTA